MVKINTAELAALDTEAINNFREYLKIPSVHPDINYEPCVEFLQRQAASLDLPVNIFHITPKHPIVIMTWTGSEPTLPAILLNSHMDVVPVFEEGWIHKPFDAVIDEHNNIYARGTQDMKSVGIQYLETIRRLKRENVRLKRTLHISFVPDEEIGGINGMKAFVLTEDYQDLNIGFALDEGMANPTEEFILFNGERSIWIFNIHCEGNPGHGSLLLDNTAGEKVSYILEKFYKFREQEKLKLKENSNVSIGDLITVNLTQMNGGVQLNVIPPELTIGIDSRIPPEMVAKWEELLNQWCSEAGPDVHIEYLSRAEAIPITKLDNSNPYWVAFRKATDKMGLKIKTQIFPGGTDGRYVRELGIPVFGFSPINNTPILLHDHNEYLGIQTFLKGIEIYAEILVSVANI